MVQIFSTIFEGYSAFYIFKTELNTPDYLEHKVK